MIEPPGRAEIDQALGALTLVARIRDEGRTAFDGSLERRLAVAFCWANVGSALKQFCRVRAIGQGTSPFPGPIRMRDKVLYQPIDDLSSAILWATCTEDVAPLVALVARYGQHCRRAPVSPASTRHESGDASREPS